MLKSISKLICKNKMKCTMVVLAAGASTRFGEDKISKNLGDFPVLIHSLKTFDACELIEEIIVVAPQESLLPIAELCDVHDIKKLTCILIGGATRLESALIGISEASTKSNYIGIHDGARPFVTSELLERIFSKALSYHACIPALMVKDTIKISPKGNFVSMTPDRGELRAVQTPQVFERTIINTALNNALVNNITIYDDASAVEELGMRVALCEGEETNIKITTPFDFKIAELILKEKEQGGAL